MPAPSVKTGAEWLAPLPLQRDPPLRFARANPRIEDWSCCDAAEKDSSALGAAALGGALSSRDPGGSAAAWSLERGRPASRLCAGRRVCGQLQERPRGTRPREVKFPRAGWTLSSISEPYLRAPGLPEAPIMATCGRGCGHPGQVRRHGHGIFHGQGCETG